MYIIPMLFKDMTLFKMQCLQKVCVKNDNINALKRLEIYYTPKSDKQEQYIKKLLLFEELEYSIEILCESSYTIKISVHIPEELAFTVNMLYTCGNIMLTQDMIFNAIRFWKEYAYIVLVDDENTPATQIEQSGYYSFY